jgi:creatinine amidohydrolase
MLTRNANFRNPAIRTIECGTAMLAPIGAVESYGEHLPAGTDNILARRLCVALIERIAGKTPVMLLPIIPFGQVWSLADQPASFSLSNETIARAVVEIGLAMKTKGLQALAVVNTHYDNAVVLKDAQRRLREEGAERRFASTNPKS